MIQVATRAGGCPGGVARGVQLHEVEPDHVPPSGYLGQDRAQLAVAEPARLR
jgi:hypothetical protein